jgi:uncharacterized iron-regulated protein
MFIEKTAALCMILITGIYGCTGFSARGFMKTSKEKIISAQTGQVVSFEMMIADAEQAKVIYIGEQHAAQLRVIMALFENHPDLSVGMEMFAKPYQPILDEWIAGNLDETAFLRKTHWYNNWRFDYQLYRDILNFVKENHICLVALNIPFHIPPKIATGGIDSLLEEEKKYLPETIDLQNSAHRTYVDDIFKQHPHGIRNFEDFYAAQCVWEDTMAESVAKNLREKMVVLAGSGHIIRNFGIPDRAFHRTQAPFKTILMLSDEREADFSSADYLWITPSHHSFKHK